MNPCYQQVQFLTSAARLSQAPKDEGIEVAFVGRSNAGKSSAINVLCRNKNLARTSKTPGRTQLLNFFSLNEQARLVDLPGYGFAKVANQVKQQWQGVLAQYLEERECLVGIMMMMDIRHPFKNYDIQMLEWANHIGLPVHILLTKADKLKKNAARNTLFKAKPQLSQYHNNASIQLFSALKKNGIDEAHLILDHWFFSTEKN